MVGRRWTVIAVAAGSLALAGCSGTSSTGTSSTTSTRPTATTAGPGATSTSPASSALAANLPVSDQLRTQLVAAAAGLQDIPVVQFTGLAPGLTYYGLDKSTGIHWAAARLVAAPVPDNANPSQAQVSTQDAGSYYVFQQPSGSPWTAYAAGNTGPGTTCPVTIPPAVLQVWGWPAGSCRPNGV